MNKIFLCYSHMDKVYVDQVATRLGKTKIFYDIQSIHSFDNLMQAMENGIQQSSIFVFFASKNSIKPGWYDFEKHLAFQKKFKDSNFKCVSIIIDNETSISDIQSPFKDAKIPTILSPNQAASTIQQELFSSTSDSISRFFVGRTKLLEKFQNEIASSEVEKSILIVSGLDGIGRKTYLEKALPDTIGMQATPFFQYDSTKNLDDIYLWLFEETCDVQQREKIATELHEFNKLSTDNQAREIAKRIDKICAFNYVPCIIDAGGILTDNGKYSDEFASIIKHVLKFDNAKLCFIHKRRPITSNIEEHNKLLFQFVDPISDSDMSLLLTNTLKAKKEPFSRSQVQELSSYLKGYPPAAYYTAALIEQYGIDPIVADKKRIVDFGVQKFITLLDQLRLSDTEKRILMYLSTEESLPLEAISAASGVTISETAPAIISLIDTCLVVRINDCYTTSWPIKNAVTRVFGALDKSHYPTILAYLNEKYWKDGSIPRMEIIDATLRAAQKSGASLDAYADVTRLSSIHRLAKDAFDSRDYVTAIDLCARAEKLGNSKSEIRAIHYKSLVKQDLYEEAERKLSEIERHGDKFIPYLKGYMARAKRQFPKAVQHLKMAIDCGDKSNSVYRDLADSLYRCKKYDEAIKYIKIVIERDSENIFVLDLIIRILTDTNNIPLASKYLEDLQRADVAKRFINHRKARVLAKTHKLDEALKAAQDAVASPWTTFESHATLADLQIMNKLYQEAEETLRLIKTKFKNKKSDIQASLKIKLLLRQGKVSHAEQEFLKLESAHTDEAKWWQLEILKAKIATQQLSLAQQSEIKEQISTLESELEALKTEHMQPLLSELLFDFSDFI